MKKRGKKVSLVVAVVVCCLLWGLCAQGEAASTITDADWVSMNPGIPGVGGNVFAMATDASGNLYVGGDFTIAGTVRAKNIAKWDGASWSALGSGMIGQLRMFSCPWPSTLPALCMPAAWFTTAGGVTANHIAKWDGSTWSALGSGMNDTVSALAIDASGTLYAGG